MTVAPVQLSKTRPPRLGIDPIARVFRIENHDEAYPIWRDAGVKDRILLHVDAHHDMWWLKDRARVSIADFICPALEDGLVREVIWVIPDGSWTTVGSRRHVLRAARKILKDYPAPKGIHRIERNRISAVVHGKPLVICSLDSLPPLEEDVLLDLDVDYLLIPRVTYGKYDEHGLLPWCWPENLLNRLRERTVSSDLVTIAHSVEGGYLPLRWKYLGDELAIRLAQPDRPDAIEGMARMRLAAESLESGDPVAAEKNYLAARQLMAPSAAPSFHLALTYARMNRPDEARRCYGEALEREPSYRTPFNSAGLWRLWQKRYREAEREFRRVAALDPDDAYAQVGLGRLAARRKRWREAELYFRRAIGKNDQLVDGWRGLGEALAKTHRIDEAIAAYETSLRLVLSGRKPVSSAVATFRPQDRLEDPYHALTFRRVAQLFEKKGELSEAIVRYRMAAAMLDGVGVRSRLALLYARQKDWKRSTLEAGTAFLRVFPATGEFFARIFRPVQDFFVRAYESWRVR
jgi:tetratricopeptide (TPR) repeat protein